MVGALSACGGSDDRAPAEGERAYDDPVMALWGPARPLKPPHTVFPACRELFEAVAALDDSSPGPLLYAARNHVFSAVSCRSVLDAMRAVPPEARTMTAAVGLMQLLEEAGLVDTVQPGPDAGTADADALLDTPTSPRPFTPRPGPRLRPEDAELPQSPGVMEYPPFGAIVLRVGLETMEFNGTVFDPRSATPTLGAALTTAIAKAKTEAEARGEEANDPLVLHVDRHIGFGRVAATIRTAIHAGYKGFRFAVADGRQLRQLVVSPARRWYPKYRGRTQPPRGNDHPTISLSVEQTRFGDQTVADLHGLESAVRRHHASYPDAFLVTVVVDPLVTMQQLVTTLDVVRGRSCDLAEAHMGGEIPDDCHLWQPILESAPAPTEP